MRTYRRVGIGVLVVGGVIVSVRLAMTGSWLPRGIGGVISFVIAELFLIPLGLLLLASAWFVRLRIDSAARSRSSGDALATTRFPAAYGCAYACASLFLTLLLTFSLSSFLSRRLEWGRIGVPVPVQISSIGEIPEKTGILIPQGARLLEGEIVWRPPGEDVFAVLEMSPSEVEEFLTGQPLWRWEVASGSWDLVISLPPEVWRTLAGRSPVTFARGWHPAREDWASAAIDRSQDDRCVVYLHWLPPTS